MKCVECNKRADYCFKGYSLCKEDFFHYYIEAKYKAQLTTKKLKKYTNVHEVPSKKQVLDFYYPKFKKIFGEI